MLSQRKLTSFCAISFIMYLNLISQILSSGPLSLSIKIRQHIPPPNTTDDDNVTTTTAPTTATAPTTTVLPDTTTLAANFTGVRLGHVVYVRVDDHPTIDNYDYRCVLANAAARERMDSSNIYSQYSDPDYVLQFPDVNVSLVEPELPPNVMRSNVPDNVCFISDKVLNLTTDDDETSIYYGVQHFFYDVDGFVYNESEVTDNSRKKRDVDVSFNQTEYWFSAELFQALCKIWNPYSYVWLTDTCEVGMKSTPSLTHCICTSLEVEPPEPEESIADRRGGYNPFSGISFASAMAVPMNTFDPTDSAFNKLGENPLIFAVMLSVVGLYLCTLIWARRWDIDDAISAGASPLLDNDPDDGYLYELTVFTGANRSAGTTAKVSMIFSGIEDETPARLIYDDKRPVLKKNGVDSFLMAVPRPLGPLNHIRVWHDNSGGSPGWQFAYMVMVDLITREKFFFVANTWLSVTEGDSIIDRIVPVASKEDLTDFTHLFWTKARQDLTDSHVWFSVFGRPHKSAFTRVQRVSVCLSLLFSTMLASMMFYQGEDSGTTGQTFNIGPLSITLRQILTGVYASLVAFPVNFFIMFIFRNTSRRKSKVLVEAQRRQKEYELKVEKQTGQKPQKPKTKFMFPWWFVGIGYFLCLAVVVVSFWACVEYGGVFGPKKAEKWLTSFICAFFESLLVSQPVKVVVFALFFAMVIKSPTIEEELDNDPGLLQGEEYLHTHSRQYNSEYIHMQRQLARYKKLPTPPAPEFIVAARKKKAKERQMQKVLKEILIYLIFVMLLYTVSYGSKDSTSHHFHRNTRNALEYGYSVPYGTMRNDPALNFTLTMPMSKVGRFNDFWKWCRLTYVPFIHGTVMYNGAPLPTGATSDGANYILGEVRFRQVRMHEENCPPAVYKYERKCSPDYKAEKENEESYGKAWTKLQDGETPDAGFSYGTAADIDGEEYIGKMDSYSGAGYTYNLGRTQQSALAAIDYLEQNEWLDTETRAVFVEFTLYNNNLNMYTVSFIVHEFVNGGAFHSKFDVKLVRLDRYRGSQAIMVLIAEILTFAYLLWFIITEVKLIKKTGRTYFTEFWNVCECLLLFLLCTATVMFFFRFYLLSLLDKRLKSDEDQYINFQKAAFYEEAYLFLLGFIIFGATIKSLKLLRFNKKINSLGLTLKYIAGGLLSFSVALILVFMAFAQMSFLVYNTLLLEFNSFIESCLTLFTLMLNKFDYKSMERANKVFAPLIFFTFTVVIGFGLISFMLTLIIDGFTAVRLENANKPNKYEIVDFLIGKFKAVAGLGSEQMPKMFDRKEDYIQDAESELNMKFGQFSEKVFSMFLQEPEDIKAMKAADSYIAQEKKKKLHKRIVSS